MLGSLEDIIFIYQPHEVSGEWPFIFWKVSGNSHLYTNLTRCLESGHLVSGECLESGHFVLESGHLFSGEWPFKYQAHMVSGECLESGHLILESGHLVSGECLESGHFVEK